VARRGIIEMMIDIARKPGPYTIMGFGCAVSCILTLISHGLSEFGLVYALLWVFASVTFFQVARLWRRSAHADDSVGP